jgi:hypothetical protein
MTPISAPARAPQTPPPTKSAAPSRSASDDEILGITTSTAKKQRDPQQLTLDFADENAAAARLDSVGAQDARVVRPEGRHGAVPGEEPSESSNDRDSGAQDPEKLRAAIDANPELRRAWDDANAYRETIGTPEEARAATALLADLDRIDALFFSRRPEDHAALARAVAELDPVAFASLAQAMAEMAAGGGAAARNAAPSSAPAVSSVGARHGVPGAAPYDASPVAEPAAQDGVTQYSAAQSRITNDAAARQPNRSIGPTSAQTEFFHATNAAAVEGVVEAIESQVERLLPEGMSKSARSRMVGEIYRELDSTLRANRQLAQQMREAFRSGSLDAEHQRAIVSLVTGRARQALPGVAKRVLNEWTSTLVAANHDRRARQRSAERRVDIAGSSGSGNDGHRSMTPRDVDYARLSDADILNM